MSITAYHCTTLHLPITYTVMVLASGPSDGNGGSLRHHHRFRFPSSDLLIFALCEPSLLRRRSPRNPGLVLFDNTALGTDTQYVIA